MDQLLSLTVVFAIQPRLYDVIELEDEGAWCCEEPGVATDVFDISPDDPISLGGFRSGGTPDLALLVSVAALGSLRTYFRFRVM